jgi:hypothetical protein
MCFDFRRLIWPITVALIGLVVEARPAFAAAPSVGDAALFDRLDADKNGEVSASEVSSDNERLFARLLRRGDSNGNEAISRDEFLAALVPTRPEKPIEAKQPSSSPQADAVRYLLLAMDTSRNSWIEADEVPDDLQPVFEIMLQRLDTNKNDTLDRLELSRGFPQLARIAGRYAEQDGIDVASELRKLEKAQGAAADRFDEQRPMLENLRDPSQARQVFTQLDANGDGKIESGEVPEPFEPQLERLLRFADRDRDNHLSKREFLTATERLSRFRGGRRPGETPARNEDRPGRSTNRDEMPAESMPAEDR